MTRKIDAEDVKAIKSAKEILDRIVEHTRSLVESGDETTQKEYDRVRGQIESDLVDFEDTLELMLEDDDEDEGDEDEGDDEAQEGDEE